MSNTPTTRTKKKATATEIVDGLFKIELASYEKPVIKESLGTEYVLYGAKNIGYTFIINRYNGSATNKTIIDSYAKYMYGKGLTSKQKASKPLQFATILSIFPKNDQKAVCIDYKLFGEAALELIYQKGELVKVIHVPKQQIAPSRRDQKTGEINSYWHSLDFAKINLPLNVPFEIEAWKPGPGKSGSYIYVLGRYQVGKIYYAEPDYSAGLNYANLEEELGEYYINHIQNGLSPGHILNMNNGAPETEEAKESMKAKYRKELAGAKNAGRFLFNFSDPGKGVTVESFPVSDAHKQYEFISSEATQKIMIAHRVTSPILFGIKDNTGLGNNAQEMEIAFNELMLTVIQPDQEDILDHYMGIFSDAGFGIDLDFIPLRPLPVKPIQTNLSSDEEEVQTDPIVADFLINLGEEIDELEWELLEAKAVECDETLKMSNHVLNLASVFSSTDKVKSEQDTDLFKVRYRYAGYPNPQRDFCVKMMKADKVYRKEDIDLAGSKVVNGGFGPGGSDTYDIWLFKGGPNCHHFWERVIYLRRDNTRITSSEARDILNELEPEDRNINRIIVNSPLVAKLPIDMPNQGYLK